VNSKKRQEGYLLIDNSFAVKNSPNPYPTKNDILRAKAAGHDFVGMTTPVFESSTITCVHCNRVVVLNPNRTREREYCSLCDSYICDNCGLSRKLGAPHLSRRELDDQIILDAERRIALSR